MQFIPGHMMKITLRAAYYIPLSVSFTKAYTNTFPIFLRQKKKAKRNIGLKTDDYQTSPVQKSKYLIIFDPSCFKKLITVTKSIPGPAVLIKQAG